MDETFDQKVMRNVQGRFAIYKTPEVLGGKTNMPNIEWEESDNVDKFFMFAQNLGAKVIYISEGEETDEETGQSRKTILQVGFLYQGVMHHINYADDSDEEEYYADDDEYEYEGDEVYEEGDGDQDEYEGDEVEPDDAVEETTPQDQERQGTSQFF